LLRPHDLGCALQIGIWAEREWSFADLGQAVKISKGEAHNACRRLVWAELCTLSPEGKIRISSARLIDFIIHGAPSAYFPVRGAVEHGMPTGAFAPPLVEKITDAGNIPLVWRTEGGKVKGETLVPLWPTAPEAAAASTKLYELLALVDAVRTHGGKARKLAASELEARLTSPTRKAA